MTGAKIADGTVAAADVGFNYAASTSKGGPASDVNCSGCVASSEVSATGSTSGQILTSNGSSVSWQNQAGFTLPVNASGANTSAAALRIENTASGGTGVLGIGLTTGVTGTTVNGDYGVRGETGQTAGYGVFGRANASSGTGVSGFGGGRGVLGSSTLGIGVVGDSASSTGVQGTSQLSAGVVGSSSNGVGVDGSSANSYGVRAQSYQTSLYALNNNGNSASLGTPDLAGDFNGGVYAKSAGWTIVGKSTGTVFAIGVRGEADDTTVGIGVQGGGAKGVEGFGAVTGVHAHGPTALIAESISDPTKWAKLGDSPNARAATFNGPVYINGTLTASGAKNFQIDHPYDPDSRYLVHTAIESGEMMNVYSGNVVLDAAGTASVDLPAWFEAININYRYQLTAIGGPAPNLHVAKKIENGRFAISGGTPGLQVSWQVAATRNDAYAIAHPFEVERDKTAAEKEHDRVVRGQ